MGPDDLNFRHLLYFWAVAKEGSIARAAERLDLSAQAVSAQLGTLERQLGQALFAPQGRSLALTDAGRTTLDYADQIFQLGDRLRHAVSDRNARQRFAVGLSDVVPKLVAFRVLHAALDPPLAMRLECSEGGFEHLLAELAINHLDLVLADRPAPTDAHLKLQSHLIGKASIALYAHSALHARYTDGFPRSVNGAPLLLPARNHPLRADIDAWLQQHELRPEVVGEFSDSALLKTFGRGRYGLFPAPAGMQEEIAAQFDARPVGTLAGVHERWYAIVTRRRIPHPAAAAILAAAGQELLAEQPA